MFLLQLWWFLHDGAWSPLSGYSLVHVGQLFWELKNCGKYLQSPVISAVSLVRAKRNWEMARVHLTSALLAQKSSQKCLLLKPTLHQFSLAFASVSLEPPPDTSLVCSRLGSSRLVWFGLQTPVLSGHSISVQSTTISYVTHCSVIWRRKCK